MRKCLKYIQTLIKNDITIQNFVYDLLPLHYSIIYFEGLYVSTWT